MIENIHKTIETAINGDVGQIIDRVGYTSIGSGLGIGAVTQSSMTMPDWLPASLASVATMVSIIGGVVMIIKFFVEMYYKRKHDAREERIAAALERRANNGDNNK